MRIPREARRPPSKPLHGRISITTTSTSIEALDALHLSYPQLSDANRKIFEAARCISWLVIILQSGAVFWVNYLGGNMRDITLNFSRPGGQVVCQYFNFLRLGREGYGNVHASCYDTAQYLASEIAQLGPFEMIYGGDPASGIPALCWTMRQGSNANFNLFSLADRLRVRGWQVPAYTPPAHCQEKSV